MRAHGDLLGGADYRPHVPYSLHDGVYASEFGSPEATLWMVVNRNGEPEGDRRGEILRVPCVSGARYFDLYHGIELDVSCPGESTTVVRFAIEALVSRRTFAAGLSPLILQESARSLRAGLRRCASLPGRRGSVRA